MNANELRPKSEQELRDEITKLKKTLTDKKEALITGKDKKMSQIAQIRKDIARISTVLREKEILKDLKG